MMDFEQSMMWRRLNNNQGNYYCQAAEPERESFRKFIKQLLHQGQITVEFKKANGELRSMICTLSEDKGAKYTGQQKDYADGNGTSPKRVNEHVCAVWDCTQNAWRSFRWDRLISVEFGLG